LSSEDKTMNDYPTVRLLLRWGNHMATAAAAAMPIFALLLVAEGWPWATLLFGLFAGAAVLILARSYVELIRIISDTLIPR
jgi:hypothetical protein